MPTTKEHLRTLIRQMPDDCTIEDVIYELYVIEKIERGLEQIERGEWIPHEQVMREAYACLPKSAGRRRLGKT